MELSRTDDEIDPGRPLADEFLILLGHAAEHTDHEAGPLLLFEANPAERRIDLVLGMLPHAAGVVEDGVGVGRGAAQLPALPAQSGDDELAVKHVHLAADRFDPEPFRHGRDSSLSGGKAYTHEPARFPSLNVAGLPRADAS